MSDFSKLIKIKASQVTPFLYLRSSALLTILQEISIEHTENLGCPRERTLDKGLLWVVAKQHIEMKRMPKYDEKIYVSTYPSKTMHVLFPRSYEIKDEKGETIIVGEAIWALIDANNRKMVNPTDHQILIPDLSNGREFNIPLHKINDSSLKEETEIKATYSYSDLNGHMNNTSYLDVAEDEIPLSFLKTHELSVIDIEYLHEIKLGETIMMRYGKTNDDSYCFSSDAFKMQLAYKEMK